MPIKMLLTGKHQGFFLFSLLPTRENGMTSFGDFIGSRGRPGQKFHRVNQKSHSGSSKDYNEPLCFPRPCSDLRHCAGLMPLNHRTLCIHSVYVECCQEPRNAETHINGHHIITSPTQSKTSFRGERIQNCNKL